MSDELMEMIPESWYEKTKLKFICLRCHKTFSREYEARSARQKKRRRGANMFSLWAWHNFRRHLLRCWCTPGARQKAAASGGQPGGPDNCERGGLR